MALDRTMGSSESPDDRPVPVGHRPHLHLVWQEPKLSLGLMNKAAPTRATRHRHSQTFHLQEGTNEFMHSRKPTCFEQMNRLTSGLELPAPHHPSTLGAVKATEQLCPLMKANKNGTLEEGQQVFPIKQKFSSTN